MLEAFLQLKPRVDTIAALHSMKAAGVRLAYVSNFSEAMLAQNSRNAGIDDLFEHILSTDRVKAFKPDPRDVTMERFAQDIN